MVSKTPFHDNLISYPIDFHYIQWVSNFTSFLLSFYLKGRDRERSPIHWCILQIPTRPKAGWARQKAATIPDLNLGYPGGGRDPGTQFIICCLPGCTLAENCIGSRVGTWVQILWYGMQVPQLASQSLCHKPGPHLNFTFESECTLSITALTSLILPGYSFWYYQLIILFTGTYFMHEEILYLRVIKI